MTLLSRPWNPDAAPVTRLAPSPTGALHLGNALTFCINWALARARGWRVLLRHDDLDGPRVSRDVVPEVEQDLRWLGLDWDERLPLQSTRQTRYETAAKKLIEARKLFRCTCTRRTAADPSGRAAPDGSAMYSGRCRDDVIMDVRYKEGSATWRFRVTEPARFRELNHREVVLPPAALDDFVVRRSSGAWSYQLASVVDDLDAGVTHVVRGEDLRASSFRQALLFETLGEQTRQPRFLHTPLVVGPDGRKLAKRHGDTRLRTLRDGGWSAARVRQMLAGWCGFADADHATPAAWVERIDPDRLPTTPIIFDPSNC
jgi:glutamyl-tRNA synthetase